MTKNELLLSVDRHGESVLAKRTKYGIVALTYANLTQATEAAKRVTNGPSGFRGDVAARWPYRVLVSAKVYGEGPFIPVRG
jgi:hypothetical protein